jgi:acyl carrier protein
MELKEIKDKLKTFICKELLNNPAYPLQDEEPLITSGLMDSFSLAQIGVFAEIQFNVYIPDSDLTVDGMNTVNQMAARIKKDLPA